MKYTVLSSIFALAVGAAVGSAVTWKILKDKHEEEIRSVREIYRANKAEAEEFEPEVFEPKTFEPKKFEPRKFEHETIETSKDSSKVAYNKIIENSGYGEPEEREDKDVPRPYVIAPEQLGENEEYETITLLYYADKVLADDNDELVEDIDSKIGLDSLTHFGEYEDDSVCVRNDARKVDYEILLSLKEYSDVLLEKEERLKND